MFSRRKSRSGHSTAYTGVNHVAPAANAPNTNALAAAHTIGNAMRAAPSRTSSVVRSPLFANYKPRASSIQRSPSTRAAFSNFNSASAHERSGFAVGAHDAGSDDYNNHETVGDLKLSGPTAIKQKMVKKYIPTPNGIKVIEVPAASMEKELARQNSMRSNSNVARLGSMTSLRSSQRRPGLRMSSLIKSPQLNRVPEERAKATSPLSSKSLEYEQLQKQIEAEERLQKDIELKRLEYERLKQKRLRDEEELRRLQLESASVLTADKAPTTIATASIPKPVLGNVHTLELDDNAHTLGNTILEATSDTSEFTTDDFIQKEIDSEFEGVFIDPANIIVDELEDKEVDDIVQEASIDPSKLVVDELESKTVKESAKPSIKVNGDGELVPEHNELGGDLSIDVSKINIDELDEKTLENFNPDGTAVDSFHTIDPDQTYDSIEDDYGIEEVLDDEATPNLAKQLRPKFDTIPSDEPLPAEDHDVGGSLELPNPAIRDASSISSATSSAYDSPSPSKGKKPIKSAMKNSTSSYTLSEKQKGNAAHQAYISLTTAENTRLNSKLSSPQLNDVTTAYSQSHHYPSAPVLNNRMSQSLRKPPPVAANGFQKTMRPQSMQVEGSKAQDSKVVGTRMSNRSLRDRSSVYVAPISPHPALQPGYHSPSKARAAELYAKANNRPHSTFKPRERSSSYSKGLEQPGAPHENGNGQADNTRPISSYRTTLRDLTRQAPNNEVAETQSNPHPSQNNPTRNTNTQGHTASRVVDSDDDLPAYLSNTSPPKKNVVSHIPKQFTPSQPQEMLTLRNTEQKQPTEVLTLRPEKKTQPAKEKKKLGRLRKLFGSKN